MCADRRVGVGGAGVVGLLQGDAPETVLDVDMRGDDWLELLEEMDESLLGRGTGRFPLPVVFWPAATCAVVSAWRVSCRPSVREGLAVLGFGSGCLLGEENDSSGTFTYWCLLSRSSSIGTFTYSGR